MSQPPRSSPTAVDLPYRQREPFLSAAELAFYRVLRDMVRERFLICPKVALIDLFTVARPNENVHYYNKIFRKNVDFLLLSPATLKPVMGIKLVRPAGTASEPRESENFLQDVFTAAGLPLVCVPTSDHYEMASLLPLFQLALARLQSAPEHDPAADYAPVCPKCGITMVLRIHRTGPQAGKRYYGCMTPGCKETSPAGG